MVRRSFEIAKQEIMRASSPGPGSSLDGFLMDIDFYLEQSALWADIEVKKTGDPDCLLAATASATPSVPPATAASELQRIWLEYLAYREREAHTVQVEDDAVTLDFVTATGSVGYVTGRITIRLPTTR